MNTRRRVTVAIGAGLHTVGSLIFESDGRRQHSVFRYDGGWLELPNAFALAPDMPLQDYPLFFSGGRANARNALPGAVSDAAPDSWGRGLIARDLGYAPDELEFLLAANDATRIGALRFLDEQGRPLAFSDPPVPRLANLVGLQQLNRTFDGGGGDMREVVRKLRGAAGSLGGARAKSDFDDGGVLTIAKYTTERDNLPIERMEVATLNLAVRVGLRAAQSYLALRDSKYPVAIIRRFDRESDTGKRCHYVSAQTLLSKAEGETGYYTDMVDALRAHGGDAGQFLGEVDELYRRVLFSILVSNNDDHLKNHGFLYTGDNGWMLAPAFDINPQPLRHRHLETGISPLSGTAASIEAAIEAAPFFEIDEDTARKAAFLMATRISEEWRKHCLQTGMTADDCNTYAAAFDHPEMSAALRLGTRRARPEPTKKKPLEDGRPR